MCNIVALSAGVSIPYDRLETCVYNNPDGFGLILKDKKNKKLQIIRRCHEDGNDPKEIFELLEDNKDIERFLHLRWRTEGPIDIENTHPFPAYISDKRQVYFMHNGSLTDFRPKTTWEGNVKTEEGVSDSKKFNDEFLSPFLLTHSGENGKADIHDPLFSKIIEKFWSMNSKGLLVCNDLDFALINPKEWKKLDFGGGEFLSSNNTYWDKLTRGPVYEARKKEEEERKRTQTSRQFQGNSVGRGITHLRDVTLKPKEVLTEDLTNIFEDYDLWTDEGTAALCNLTAIELEDLCKRDAGTAAALLVHLTSNFDELYKRKERMATYIKEFKKTGKMNIDNSDQKELDI